MSAQPRSAGAPEQAPLAGAEAPDPRAQGVFAVARKDVIALALLALAHVAGLGVIGALVFGHVSLLRRTSDLQVRLRGVSDVDGRLALLEKQIAVQLGEIEAAKSRISAEVRPSAIADRVEFKAKELNLAIAPDTISETNASVAISPEERLELRRFDRSVDVRGGFKEVASLIAEVEAWPELVAIRAMSIRRGGKSSETLAHVEVSLYQTQSTTAPPGGPR